MSPSEPPYAGLTPDTVLDALASAGFLGDGRLLALNSYENRVYQVWLEDAENGPPSVVAKFYRRSAGAMRRSSRSTRLRPSSPSGKSPWLRRFRAARRLSTSFAGFASPSIRAAAAARPSWRTPKR